jgi:hypothetical protein
MASIRRDKQPADEAAEVLGARPRTAQAALREVVALKRFKKLMSKYAGKLKFSGQDQ